RPMGDEAFHNSMASLRSALAQADLEEPERWLQLIDLAETSFVGDLSAYEIRQAIDGGSHNLPALTVLHLALMHSPGSSLEDVCGAQIVCLTTFKKSQIWTTQSLNDVAAHVVIFWHDAVLRRSFALRGPSAFRQAIEGLDTPTPANAARILLAA